MLQLGQSGIENSKYKPQSCFTLVELEDCLPRVSIELNRNKFDEQEAVQSKENYLLQGWTYLA